jgi:hypothetical protein
MKKQGNTTPLKLSNSTIMDFNNSEVNKISDKEFKRMIIKMINEIKEDMNKWLNEFQEMEAR